MNDKIIEINDIMLKLSELKKWIYEQEKDDLEDSFSRLYRCLLDYRWNEEDKDKRIFLVSQQDKKNIFRCTHESPFPQHKTTTGSTDL